MTHIWGTTGKNGKQLKLATSHSPSRSLLRDKKVAVENAENLSSMTKNSKFTTCWLAHLGVKVPTAIWRWFTSSVINRYTRRPNGQCETVNSSTNENSQTKKLPLDNRYRMRKRSRVVRDGLKLCALRGACTVSRGGSCSNAASLPASFMHKPQRSSKRNNSLRHG